jgi:tetratricopeptide (TPR) repeat protein
MAAKRTTRKELLKKPDEFITFSSKVALFVSSHLRQIKLIGLAIGVAAILYLGGYAYISYVNKKGQEIYNKGYVALEESLEPDGEPEKLKESSEHFATLIDEYSLASAARLALPQIAYVRFLDGQYDEAASYYREFLEKVSGDRDYRSLSQLALAACFEARGDIKTAKETLDPILGGPDDKFKEIAMLNLARLHRLENQDAKSKEILSEFVEKFKDSPFQPFAKALL